MFLSLFLNVCIYLGSKFYLYDKYGSEVWGTLANDYVVQLVLLTLLAPILWQIVKCWLYSSVYKNFLHAKLKAEGESYRQAEKAVKERNSDIAPAACKNIILNTAFKDGEVNFDKMLSELMTTTLENVKNYTSPSLLQLVGFYLEDTLTNMCQFRWHSKNIDEHVIPNMYRNDENHRNNEVVPENVNFQVEYNHYLDLKRKKQVQSLQGYCEKRDISYQLMSEWRKDNKNKT